MNSIILQGIPAQDGWNAEEKDILRLGIVQSVAGAGVPEDGNWCETFNMAGEVELTEGDVIVLRRFLDLWLGEEG
jgi:hypothetical protein